MRIYKKLKLKKDFNIENVYNNGLIICNYLGPYYEKTIFTDDLEDIYTIIEKYFFDGGWSRGYYPLDIGDNIFIDVFNIVEKDYVENSNLPIITSVIEN